MWEWIESTKNSSLILNAYSVYFIHIHRVAIYINLFIMAKNESKHVYILRNLFSNPCDLPKPSFAVDLYSESLGPEQTLIFCSSYEHLHVAASNYSTTNKHAEKLWI